MKKILYLILTGLILGLVSSCSNFDESDSKVGYTKDLSAIKIDNGIIIIPNKDYLKQIVIEYKKSTTEQDNFNSKIKEYQNNGFKPLIPCFEGLSAKEIQEFAQRKKERIDQRNRDFGILNKDSRDFELDLDEDIVSDPVLSSLLNEDSEIIVDDILYKYTELGLFFIQKDNKQILLDYINSKTPEEKYNLLMQYNSEYSTTNKPQEKIENLDNGLTTFRIQQVQNPPSSPLDPDFDGGSGGGSSAPTQGNGILDPSTFGECKIQKDGFFENIFGESESCHEYYNDNRRVKVKFWNQNYLIFSSIGASTRLQKRESINVLFGTISWWEKSYATQMKLGINNVVFKYDFNVPIFNQAQYNYQTTFFEFNGTKYNSSGQVISTVPTSPGRFNFPVNNYNNVVDITILANNIELNNGQVNQVIDSALNQLISGIENYSEKQSLLSKKAAGLLEVRVLYAVPFTNSVKFIIAKQNWYASNDNAIVHVFDFNFLLTYNSNSSSALDYLKDLNGSTSYTLDKADLYGAALHNNYWKGRRLFKD